jgi:cation diffusion facilitator CzcD-associated flavoprotein CzcO
VVKSGCHAHILSVLSLLTSAHRLTISIINQARKYISSLSDLVLFDSHLCVMASHATGTTTNGVGPDTEHLDALIVGAGFGGCYQLRQLREGGFKVKLVDNATDYGGVWYWNRYPGARVDSSIPHYEYSDPDLWSGWRWKQRFPGHEELRDYFAYVADKWNLRPDTQFETHIDSACWREDQGNWLITTKTGHKYVAQYFLLNTGFAAKRHVPDFPGIDKFQGLWVHPSYWPKDKSGADFAGKRIAVIGTGATGIQLSQALSKVAGHFTLFQRTPNLALPMKQIEYPSDLYPTTQKYAEIFAGRPTSFGGFDFNFLGRGTFDDTPEQRRETYERLWAEGDFHFWLATYYDMLFTPEANKEAYDFWKAKVRARLGSEALKDSLAPEVQPHAFGCKRISLEKGFYEIFNEDHVELVDLKKTPVVEVTEKGIRTSEKEIELDVVVCATGFDAITGGILLIDIRGRDGMQLKDKWKAGTKTYLGMAVSGFPNMFFTYGVSPPVSLSRLCQAVSAFARSAISVPVGSWLCHQVQTLSTRHILLHVH